MNNSDREKDLFVSTLVELGNPAPPALVQTLKGRLEHISATNPNRAQTAQSCLKGLSHCPTLMHVLTAAYLTNGGVMMKEDPVSLTEDLEEFERELQGLHLEENVKGCEQAGEGTEGAAETSPVGEGVRSGA